MLNGENSVVIHNCSPIFSSDAVSVGPRLGFLSYRPNFFEFFLWESFYMPKGAVESHNNFLRAKSYLRHPTAIVIVVFFSNEIKSQPLSAFALVVQFEVTIVFHK